MKTFSLGVNILSKDLGSYLLRLREIGFEHLYYNGGLFARPESELQEAVDLCDQHGIMPFAAHAPGQFLPDHPDKLADKIAQHKAMLDKAHLLRCQSVTFHVGSVDNVRNEESAAFIAAIGADRFDEMNFRTVRELADHAARRNMKIAIENLSRDIVNNYVRDIVDIERVIAGADVNVGVGICVDAGHANISALRAGDMIRRAGSCLIETHFNDNFGWLSPINAINDIHRPPGVGTVDWVDVVAALHEIHYAGPVIFELGPKFDTDDVDTFLRLAYDNWRQFESVYRFHQESEV
jgi:sugar phosphate isomerase/epimerase